MNVFCFTGNLGSDCEIRYTADGMAVANFNVAVSSGYGDKAKTTWARCSLFGKRAESLSPYLLKGKQVAVSGELTLNTFTNRDGIEKSSLEVRVNDLNLIGGRSEQQEPKPQQQPAQKPNKPAKAHNNIDDQSIPF